MHSIEQDCCATSRRWLWFGVARSPLCKKPEDFSAAELLAVKETISKPLTISDLNVSISPSLKLCVMPGGDLVYRARYCLPITRLLAAASKQLS
ncbi:hypothetical protein [Methylocystis sp. MJC1]|uniref:hypothetical protein n=1 Tax=Methylocystis sp. MJC1 TaxID=2654282 RepID=UPI0019D2E1B3|nr:hypothetical protein [Methylocystis sp. MJC1]